MRYKDIKPLTREDGPAGLFLSLPLEMQCCLAERGAYTHTAEELRRRAREMEHFREQGRRGGFSAL